MTSDKQPTSVKPKHIRRDDYTRTLVCVHYMGRQWGDLMSELLGMTLPKWWTIVNTKAFSFDAKGWYLNSHGVKELNLYLSEAGVSAELGPKVVVGVRYKDKGKWSPWTYSSELDPDSAKLLERCIKHRNSEVVVIPAGEYLSSGDVQTHEKATGSVFSGVP